MEIILAILAGTLVAAGSYLMMSGKTLPYLFGLTMISNAANLVIFASGRLTYGEPPLVEDGAKTVVGAANALPQALILTAIVISFAVMAFLLTLIVMTARKTDTLNVDDLATEAEIAAEG